MKKMVFMAAICIAALFTQNANAQVSVSMNIGVQPVWGPVGYDYANYYYLPDLDAYYDVPNHQYMFFDRGRWVAMPNLPPQYRDFDLYHAYKVVINDPNPWFHHDRYRSKYAMYRGHHEQAVIRDSRDQRYWANPGHPHHGEWHGDNRDHGRPRDDHRGHEERHDDHRDDHRDDRR